MRNDKIRYTLYLNARSTVVRTSFKINFPLIMMVAGVLKYRLFVTRECLSFLLSNIFFPQNVSSILVA